MSSYLIDRANGPRTIPFPTWTSVPVWHEDAGCYLHGARYFPEHHGGLVRVYAAAYSCVDMTGTLFSVLPGRTVRRVETFSGMVPDTVYLRGDNGEWEAYRPSGLPEALGDGEAIELPATYEDQTPATDLPKLPFAKRPGTVADAPRVRLVRDALGRVEIITGRKIAEAHIDAIKAKAALTARINARFAGEEVVS